MFTAYVFAAVGAVADAVGWAVGEDYVDCWMGWDGVGGVEIGGGCGGWGVEPVDMPLVGECPAAEFGLVGGGVDLFIYSESVC